MAFFSCLLWLPPAVVAPEAVTESPFPALNVPPAGIWGAEVGGDLPLVCRG